MREVPVGKKSTFAYALIPPVESYSIAVNYTLIPYGGYSRLRVEGFVDS
jgi:hypothetical protein